MRKCLQLRIIKLRLSPLIAYFLLLAIMSACGTTKEDNIHSRNDSRADSVLPSDTISVTKPSDSNYNIGSVFVDHVSKFEHDGHMQFKIAGALPDGCSNLYKVQSSIKENELHLNLKSWRPSGVMCTQALVDFTYISERMDSEELKDVTHFVFNNEKAELILTEI